MDKSDLLQWHVFGRDHLGASLLEKIAAAGNPAAAHF